MMRATPSFFKTFIFFISKWLKLLLFKREKIAKEEWSRSYRDLGKKVIKIPQWVHFLGYLSMKSVNKQNRCAVIRGVIKMGGTL